MSGGVGDGIDPANHEVVTDNFEVGISIKNLTKIFGLVSYYNCCATWTFSIARQ